LPPASRRRSKSSLVALKKAPTGIAGLDDITGGGLPVRRTTLVVGPSGAGKTVLAMQFILYGITECGEPGVYVSFEENVDELAVDFKSLGYDIKALSAAKRMIIDHVEVPLDSSLITGDYSLEGLLLRLASDIDAVGAKRVVLDGVGALFRGLQNHAAIRSFLDHLFRSLKERGVTTIVTTTTEDEFAEQGLGRTLGDCIILLGQRIADNLSTRYLRVAKYRGSSHGADEFPFLISKSGISVEPITSVLLDYPASGEVVSSGIPKLDVMLGGKGYYRGSSVLVSGEPGTGKTSLAGHFAVESCRRGGRCLYLALEESGSQLIRNMRSIGLDLEPWVSSGNLRVQPMRPSSHGLETHLVTTREIISDFDPQSVVVDPLTSLAAIGTLTQVRSMLARLVYFLKAKGITACFTSLTSSDVSADTGAGISSLMDAWIELKNVESNGERNRTIHVLKSRGVAHSNQMREFVLSERGVDIVQVYVNGEGVKVGSARVAHEARDRALKMKRQVEIEHSKSHFENMKRRIEAQIAELQSQIELARLEMEARLGESRDEEEALETERKAVGRLRGV
jgi:circadian clock protein KaiC